jgi:hypothetical protein
LAMLSNNIVQVFHDDPNRANTINPFAVTCEMRQIGFNLPSLAEIYRIVVLAGTTLGQLVRGAVISMKLICGCGCGGATRVITTAGSFFFRPPPVIGSVSATRVLRGIRVFKSNNPCAFDAICILIGVLITRDLFFFFLRKRLDSYKTNDLQGHNRRMSHIYNSPKRAT